MAGFDFEIEKKMKSNCCRDSHANFVKPILQNRLGDKGDRVKLKDSHGCEQILIWTFKFAYCLGS